MAFRLMANSYLWRQPRRRRLWEEGKGGVVREGEGEGEEGWRKKGGEEGKAGGGRGGRGGREGWKREEGKVGKGREGRKGWVEEGGLSQSEETVSGLDIIYHMYLTCGPHIPGGCCRVS